MAASPRLAATQRLTVTIAATIQHRSIARRSTRRTL
jgi:hypothetical protein